MGVKVEKLDIEGAFIITPDYFYDSRGYYCETYSERSLREQGIVMPRMVQDNHSFSVKRGTIRGIHFQINPKPQCKLVRCTRGKILDVIVDLRRKSSTFKKWIAVELSEENHKQILIPNYCGHAFLTLTDNAEVQYKVDEFYFPKYDRSIKFDDPEIGIDWPIQAKDVVKSQKDIDAPALADSDVNY